MVYKKFSMFLKKIKNNIVTNKILYQNVNTSDRAKRKLNLKWEV